MQRRNSNVGRIRINVHLLLTQHTKVSAKSCSFVVLHLSKRNFNDTLSRTAASGLHEVRPLYPRSYLDTHSCTSDTQTQLVSVSNNHQNIQISSSNNRILIKIHQDRTLLNFPKCAYISLSGT